MEPTQVGLILGLLALLAILLVGRSVGRRRASRADAQTEVAPEPLAAESEIQAQADAQAEPEVEPEPAEAPAGAEVEPESTVEAEADPEPEAPARRRWFFRRRRRQTAADVVPADADLESDDVVPAPVGVSHDVETKDHAELRALREQLRALEQVVQEQAADHPGATLARVEETAAEQSAAYLRQVSLVVRGLAAHTSEDENPRRTLDRVAAAVERLGVPNQMARPILPVSNELPSRSEPEAPTDPSHLLEVARFTDDAPQLLPPPSPVTDVFAGLDSPSVATTMVSYSELEAVARYEEPLTRVQDVEPPSAYEPEPEPAPEPAAGIATFDVPTVLPVPPPAAAEPTARRRGRARKAR